MRQDRVARLLLTFALLLVCARAGAQSTLRIGDLSTLQGWSGLTESSDGATLALPGEAVFKYPDGEQGWHYRGLRREHDGTRDWRDYAGLSIDIQVPDDRAIELTA